MVRYFFLRSRLCRGRCEKTHHERTKKILLRAISIDTKDFRFNRDEANER